MSSVQPSGSSPAPTSTPSPTVELLYAGNAAAALCVKTSAAAAGWNGLGASEDDRVKLAEGPLWDPHSSTLYFIDILGKKLHALHTGTEVRHSEWRLPQLPGTVALTDTAGVLLVAMQDGLYWFDTRSGQCVHSGVDCEPGVADNRCNDGKVDPGGRLVVGTMCLDESERGKGKGGLYCVDASGGAAPGGWKCSQLLSGLSIPNGLAWTKDNRRFFHTDTPTRCIREYQYDEAAGSIAGEGRVAVALPEEYGHPDGLTIDDEDKLWIASWGGGAVFRYCPNSGALLQRLDVGGGYLSRVSSCTFGGADLSDLYITTAAPDEPFDYTTQGLAGSVFVARGVGAKGRQATPFKGALHMTQP